MKNLLLLSASIFLLTACSPKYIVKTNYKHPFTKSSNECIKTCNSKRKKCQTSCNHKYDNCLQRGEHNAKENQSNLIYDYDVEMIDYRQDMDRYRFEFDRWEDRRDILKRDYKESSKDCARIRSRFKDEKEKKKLKSCKKTIQIEKKFHHHRDSLRPTEPSRPIRPSLSDEIERFQKKCSRSCSCDKFYNSCFVSCGGEVSYQKICVENCE